MKQALLGIDRFWCGSSLVRAESLFALSTATQNPLKLAMLRFFSIIALFCELFGVFLLVQGAISHEPKHFLLGALIKAGSYLASGVFHNQSGIYLQLWWSEHLETVRRYQKEFSGILNQLGLTDQEIQSIPSLPQELYSSELTSYPYSRLLNLSMPLVCSIVLIMQQPPRSMSVVNIPFEEGVIIREFLPKAFLSSTHPLKPLSVSIPKGGVHVLQVPSGSGKSVLILSLLHLIDHHGEIVFVKNRTAINLHTLSQEECSKAFVFFRNGDLLPSAPKSS